MTILLCLVTVDVPVLWNSSWATDCCDRCYLQNLKTKDPDPGELAHCILGCFCSAARCWGWGGAGRVQAAPDFGVCYFLQAWGKRMRTLQKVESGSAKKCWKFDLLSPTSGRKQIKSGSGLEKASDKLEARRGKSSAGFSSTWRRLLLLQPQPLPALAPELPGRCAVPWWVSVYC